MFDAGFADLGDILRDAPDAPLPLIVALDQVQDPGNVGTLARTLYAMGAAGLVVVRHGGAALGGAAARAAAGALEKLPVTKVTNLARALDEADEAGYTIYAAGGATTDGDGKPGSAPLNPFTEPLRTPAVLVLGNEDTGIRPNVAKRCHFTLTIPWPRLRFAERGAGRGHPGGLLRRAPPQGIAGPGRCQPLHVPRDDTKAPDLPMEGGGLSAPGGRHAMRPKTT